MAIRKGDKSKSAFGKGAGKGQQYTTGVPLWKLFLKAQIRSYAADDGSMLLTGGEKATKFFTIKNWREHLSAEAAELYARPAMGIHLLAGTMSSGIEVMQCLPRNNQLDEAAYKDTGIPQMKRVITDELEGILRDINVHTSSSNTKKDMKKTLMRFFKVFGDTNTADERMKSLSLIHI